MFLASCSEQKAQTAYTRTTARLDVGGDYLYYASAAERNRIVKKFYGEFFDLFSPELGELGVDPAAAVKTLHLEAVEAQGISSVRLASGVWQMKCFAYTPNKPADGLFALCDNDNREFPELAQLPESTILAASYTVRPAALWAIFRRMCAVQPEARWQNLPARCEQAVKRELGLTLDELLKALDGDCRILVTGNLDSLKYRFSISDRGGVLAKLIRKQCGMEETATRVAFPGEFPVKQIPAPVLLLGNDRLTVEGGDIGSEIAAAAKSGGLLKNPEFAACAAGLPRKITGYAVVNFPAAQVLEKIVSSMPRDEKSDKLAKLAAKVKTVRIVAVSTSESDGYMTTVRSGISLPALAEAYPAIALPLTCIGAAEGAKKRVDDAMSGRK